MGETFYIPFKKQVEKEHHLRSEANAYGEHDAHYFFPATDGKLRCFKCNKLFDASILDTKRCPQCLFEISKKDAKDMYIEAVYMKVNYGGWNPELLDLLSTKKEPSMIRPDGHITPLTDAARSIVAYYVQQFRQKTQEDFNTPPEVRRMREKSLSEAINKQWTPRRLDGEL